MPLVHIYLRAGKTSEYKQEIGAAIQQAMVEHLNVPERDRFQVIQEYSAQDLVYDPHYLQVERSDDFVMIQVTLSAGRSTDQKRAFYKRLADLLQEKPGLRPQDLALCLVENTREDWSFGNGEASYLVLPPEEWK